MKINAYFIPGNAAAEVQRLRAGGTPRSESDALELRTALSAGRPGFQATADVLADLRELIHPPVPIPSPAASVATVTPVPVVPPSAPAAPTAGQQLLAEYEAASRDPAALADFIAENGKALRRLSQSGLSAGRVPPAAGAKQPDALVAAYEAARNDPTALANFLDDNHSALRRLTRQEAAPAAPEQAPDATEDAVTKCVTAAEVESEYRRLKDSPGALAKFLTVNGAMIRAALVSGQIG